VQTTPPADIEAAPIEPMQQPHREIDLRLEPTTEPAVADTKEPQHPEFMPPPATL